MRLLGKTPLVLRLEFGCILLHQINALDKLFLTPLSVQGRINSAGGSPTPVIIACFIARVRAT